MTILIRPRETMRRILDRLHETGKDRMVLPLILLALFTGFVSDFDAVQVSKIAEYQGLGSMMAIIFTIVVIVLLVMVALFFIFAWLAYMIGRALDGTGTIRDVRSGMAWGLAPMAWSLLYAIPVAIFYGRTRGGGVRISDDVVRFSPTSLGDGCGWLLLIALLDFIVFIWTVVVMSHTLGEAHRFSSLRGFATLCLLLITPAVITIAAALTMAF